MSAVQDLIYSTKLVATTCASCGVPFGIPANFDSARRSDGRSFYCPNGHNLSFHETDADRLRKEKAKLEEAKARQDEYVRHLQESVDREKARHAATKGQLTKAKKRAQGGACPCCNRTFVQLSRHMATKHPDFDPTESVGESES